jgi:PPOX class probable F420-dependent enzyme
MPGGHNVEKGSAMIPPSHRDLVEQALPAVLVTLFGDGRPQASVVWFAFVDGTFEVNSERGRLKVRNLEHDCRVVLVIVDAVNQHRYLEVRGDVTTVTEEGALVHRAHLDRKYLGEDHHTDQTLDKGARVIISITPMKVIAYG